MKPCRISPKALEAIINNLVDSYDRHGGLNHIDGPNLPSRQVIAEITLGVESLLFPGYVAMERVDALNLRYAIGKRAVDTFDALVQEVGKSLNYALREPLCRDKPEMEGSVEDRAQCVVTRLFEALPRIRELLAKDAQAALAGDPAAKSHAEVILSYPGMHAIAIHRVAHFLYLEGIPLIPRMMSELVHRRTGIDIHPGAMIGESFFIDHGTGVVIGETTLIGDRVKIYQGVTLGALSVPEPDLPGARMQKRHPTIEDDVTIYAGATILGGDTVVGARSVVGGSVWLTHSVEADTKVLFQPTPPRIKNGGSLGGASG